MSNMLKYHLKTEESRKILKPESRYTLLSHVITILFDSI